MSKLVAASISDQHDGIIEFSRIVYVATDPSDSSDPNLYLMVNNKKLRQITNLNSSTELQWLSNSTDNELIEKGAILQNITIASLKVNINS